MTAFDPLLAVGALDGRYRARVAAFAEFCGGEAALIRARVEIEIEWLLCLLRETSLGRDEKFRIDESERAKIEAVSKNFDLEADLESARRVKEIERKTRHDVKAVEIWIGEALARAGLFRLRPLVHFGLTSWDVNNLAYARLMRHAAHDFIAPAIEQVESALAAAAREWADIPMLARTHGQPATPTTVGKECANFAYRLAVAAADIRGFVFCGKLNGASGNYNALCFALPDENWPQVARDFVESLGFRFSPYTTQIEPYDNLAAFFDLARRANNVGIDLCRDFWGYIALSYFRQKVVAGEVGSSTMPHKVNPIDFENAEGRFGVANALLSHFSDKLPISRWQRDLSDSTVLRDVGAALAGSVVGWDSALAGLGKITPDRDALKANLDANPQVVAEAAQTLFRAHGDGDAYEKLKEVTRGASAPEAGAALEKIIATADLNAVERERLLRLRAKDYLGLAAVLAREYGPK